MIARLQQYFGFTKMPFGKSLAPGALHRHGAHAEAVARISWAVAGAVHAGAQEFARHTHRQNRLLFWSSGRPLVS